jgi:hypothetical protein
MWSISFWGLDFVQIFNSKCVHEPISKNCKVSYVEIMWVKIFKILCYNMLV